MNAHFIHKTADDLKSIRFSSYIEMQFLVHFKSKKAIKKAIGRQEFLLNNRIAKSGDWVSAKDCIAWEDKNIAHKILPLSIPVHYEDEYLAVVIKPAGLVVSGNQFRTLRNALPYNLSESPQIDRLTQPLPIHRLDALTYGLVIIAKTKTALIQLSNNLAQSKIKKVYRAVVQGKIASAQSIITPVNNKESLSTILNFEVSPSLTYDNISDIEIKANTGRTHQLRIHLAQIGHPIIGDKIYSNEKKVLSGKGLFLAACAVRFKHPVTNSVIDLSIAPPNKFKSYIDRERRRFLTLKKE